MRHLTKARLAVPAAAVITGILVAAPAFADASVSPSSAVQGSGENLTFHVTNTGTAPIATVSVRLPDDTQVAEVYPLSVDDWAPRTEMRALSTPLPTIHGDTTATQAAGAITWLAMPGHLLAPGKSADLPVALGPLPDTTSMQFDVLTTYAGGRPGPVMPVVTLKLTPDTDGSAAAAAHAGHDEGTTDTGQTADPDAAQFAQITRDAGRGPTVLSLAGWIVAAFALLGGVLMVLRSRHRAAVEDEEPAPDEQDEETAKEPVAAGKWSLRG